MESPRDFAPARPINLARGKAKAEHMQKGDVTSQTARTALHLRPPPAKEAAARPKHRNGATTNL